MDDLSDLYCKWVNLGNKRNPRTQQRPKGNGDTVTSFVDRRAILERLSLKIQRLEARFTRISRLSLAIGFFAGLSTGVVISVSISKPRDLN